VPDITIGVDADGYANIFKAYEASLWGNAEKYGVTKIAPVGHASLSFFPGQYGFVGPEFPIGGIMVVANNFDNLAGWATYEKDLTAEDNSNTMVKFKAYVVPETGEPLQQFWFTNYCLGVMDRKDSQYTFPRKAVEALEFKRFFEACVKTMQPRLIVTLGAPAAVWVGTDYADRKRVDEKTFGDHATRLLAIVHTSGWTWNRKGFSKVDFRAEGRRIRESLVGR